MSGLSNGQQALLMFFAFLIPVLTSVSTWAALGMPTDRSALGILVSSILGGIVAGIIAFSKEILGGKPAETTSSTPQSPAKTQLLIRRFASKFKFFFVGFLHDRTATARPPHRRGSGRYDPDPSPPRPKSKGHRRGGLPKSIIKKYGISKKAWSVFRGGRTHDPHPGFRRSFSMGPRGGHYFRGPHKKRYDPAPPRRFHYVHRAGSKIEGIINRFGMPIGALIAGLMGVWKSYSDYQTAFKDNAPQDYINTIIGGQIKDASGAVLYTKTPEISHLWQNEGVWTPYKYLQFKFLGHHPDDPAGTNRGSAWVIPFWIGLGATIAAPIARLFTHKGQRFLRPLSKVGKGMLVTSTVGALALPGCPKPGTSDFPPPPPANVLSISQIQPGQFAQAPIRTIEFTYKG
jgi:hypothetical protein